LRTWVGETIATERTKCMTHWLRSERDDAVRYGLAFIRSKPRQINPFPNVEVSGGLFISPPLE